MGALSNPWCIFGLDVTKGASEDHGIRSDGIWRSHSAHLTFIEGCIFYYSSVIYPDQELWFCMKTSGEEGNYVTVVQDMRGEQYDSCEVQCRSDGWL